MWSQELNSITFTGPFYLRFFYDSVISTPGKSGGLRCLKACQCDAHLQEGPKGGYRELQARQADHSIEEVYEADHLEYSHTTCAK